jgi:hypothetical protein
MWGVKIATNRAVRPAFAVVRVFLPLYVCFCALGHVAQANQLSTTLAPRPSISRMSLLAFTVVPQLLAASKSFGFNVS